MPGPQRRGNDSQYAPMYRTLTRSWGQNTKWNYTGKIMPDILSCVVLSLLALPTCRGLALTHLIDEHNWTGSAYIWITEIVAGMFVSVWYLFAFCGCYLFLEPRRQALGRSQHWELWQEPAWRLEELVKYLQYCVCI